jgi:(E)-4-hydroxy-3-methylbut-2-enyl-diphosphate synthase
MVESTLEFLRICKEENFHDVVISMKASNPIVMIQSVRLLVKTMDNEHMHYPIHLGVTEAGNELEGRIKSAVGIGSLLIDGIGDTIRVSLTESPKYEIPVAKHLVDLFNEKTLSNYKNDSIIEFHGYLPLKFKKRKTTRIGTIGGNNVPIVISDIKQEIDNNSLKSCGFQFNTAMTALVTSDLSSDFIFSKLDFNSKLNAFNLKLITEKPTKKNFTLDYFSGKLNSEKINKPGFLEISDSNYQKIDFETLKLFNKTVLILNFTGSNSVVHSGRTFFALLSKNGIKNPVIFKKEIRTVSEKEILELSAEFGALFIDGLGDGLWISCENDKDIKKAGELSFGILQACRTRITKTEYISCPSCGRTLFNLEETTAKIKEKTAHLKGIKIGIMGCVVNGPGEMADADFGYVGTGPGKITLYRKQTIVKRNIPEEQAVDELLQLIEQHMKLN